MRLSDGHERNGEIPLSELAKLADKTQLVVSRLARGLIEAPTPHTSVNVVEATTLYLVGLSVGSTILDIAGPEPRTDALLAEGMPGNLGDMALSIFVDSFETLSQPAPILPVNVDRPVVTALDSLLRSLRNYSRVEIDADLDGEVRSVVIEPRAARTNLRHAESQPSLPFVSARHQVLSGRLYALNLRTGIFSIEDDSGHSIRVSVPDELRSEAAQLVDTRVRALGRALLDRQHRLRSFEVEALDPVPVSPIGTQDRLFREEHHLAVTHPLTGSLDAGIISDLSEDEIDAFVAALEAE
jgi:hypothetical protein